MSTVYKMFLAIPIMLALHVFADYHLQGILASMKQKIWWENEGNKYKDDYKIALVCHAFEWSFVVMLPMLYTLFREDRPWSLVLYILLLIANTCFHYAADDMKANDKTINLADDQLLHMIQLGFTWALWSVTGW